MLRVSALERVCCFVVVALLCPIAAQATETILAESFEGPSLDPRIAITSVGEVSASVKPTALFGSDKAFGFGRSSCWADCWDRYVSTLVITFPQPVYVTSLSFREIEEGRNIGSGGAVLVDGTPLVIDGRASYQTFGRLPYNDDGYDSTYRTRTFTLNKPVTRVQLQSWDISGHSELFIDDIRIVGVNAPSSYAQAFNATANWSYTRNPNGAWSYNNGASPLPDAVVPWHNIPETFWSYPPYLAEGQTEPWDATPAWTKVRNSSGGWAPSGDLGIDDVVVHSTNPWERPGLANLTWTSPGAGTIDVSGSIWDAYHYPDRNDSWGLMLNGNLLAFRGVIQGVGRNEAAASLAANLEAGQALGGLTVEAGDVLEFYVQPTTSVGQFVGVDLTVQFNPTASQAVALLEGAVLSLSSSGALTQNQASGLMDKLDAATGSLGLGNTRGACSQIQAFIKQTEGFVKSSRLSAAEGQILIDSAKGLLVQFGC